MPEIKNMDQGLRKNIQKTAAKLFIKYGLRSVSIDDICNELRISKKTFYVHFTQKEELIESVLVEHDEKHHKKRELRPGGCEFKGNAIDWLFQASLFHSSTKNDRFVNFLYDLNKYYPEIQKKIAQHKQNQAYESIQLNIQQGIEEGLFRSDFNLELMTRFQSILFTNIINLTSSDLGGNTMRQVFALTLDIYVRSLCNKTGLDYYESLQKEKSEVKQAEEEPMKDEEIDLMIDRYMDSTGDLNSED